MRNANCAFAQLAKTANYFAQRPPLLIAERGTVGVVFFRITVVILSARHPGRLLAISDQKRKQTLTCF